MLEKIRAALRIHGYMLPKVVREVLEEIGGEVDRLRAELDQVKSQQPPKE